MKNFFKLMLLAPAVLAQSNLPSPSAQSLQPRFEIADVHVSKTVPGFVQRSGGELHEGLYINRDATILDLLATAYGVPKDTIAGGPGWVASDLFDVVARVPGGTTMATAKLMLRDLLAERFGMVVRNEVRPIPRYVLSVGSGSKLKLATGSGEPRCEARQGAVEAAVASRPGDFSSVPNNELRCYNFTAALIASWLRSVASGYLDHDVIDSTRLAGTWDFDLEWTGRAAFAAKGPVGISIFDAVDKQLGLKLQLQDVPLPSLAIASINRMPSPNPSNIEAALSLPEAHFEVAVVKLADPSHRPFNGIGYSSGTEIKAGGTLRALMATMLEISPNIATDMIVGLPKWADTQVWDITAKLPVTGDGAPRLMNGQAGPPPHGVILEMLRGMLLDQFELKTHTEKREVTVYALTKTAKLKLVRADAAERSGCSAIQTPAKPGQTVETKMTCNNASTDDLAQNLVQVAQAYIDHPIVNATALQGGWDFAISWTPVGVFEKVRLANQTAESAAVSYAPLPDGITLFEAVERQLGLKLVKQKLSIPVTVVDHVDEKPLN